MTECANDNHNFVHEYDDESMLGDLWYCTKCDWFQVG